MALSQTSELDAVNVCLMTIGEQPVSSLDVSGDISLSIAQLVLDETVRAVQLKGWGFNTDYDWQTSLDVDGKIPVPSNTLRIDPSDPNTNYVERSGFLWDVENNTFVFSTAPKIDIVRVYEFEEIPEAARNYIKIKAARIFQRRVLGDENVNFFTSDDEDEALAVLHDYDHESQERSLLNDPTLWTTVRSYRRSF